MRKRSGFLAQRHHYNARPHTALLTREAINKLSWEILPRPHYTQDLASSDFHLLDPLKEVLFMTQRRGQSKCLKLVPT